MSTIGLLTICSLAFVGGVWLATTGWRQRRPSLERAVHHLRRPAERSTPPSGTAGGVTRRVGAATLATRAGARTGAWTQPLRLIGRSVDEHVGILVLSSLTALVVPPVLLVVLQQLGVVSIGVWVPAGVSLLAAVLVPMAVHSDALSRSAAVRTDLRHQLGAYLDMVTMLLAGNSGYEGALEQAARAGDGLLFRQLRRRMREVSATGRSLVDALALVAADFGLVELEQVAATASLSAAEGAPVARSLSAKCATLRSTLAAEEEAQARIRNDKVTPPLVGMALLFMALIIYPALGLG